MFQRSGSCRQAGQLAANPEQHFSVVLLNMRKYLVCYGEFKKMLYFIFTNVHWATFALAKTSQRQSLMLYAE